MYQCLHVRLQGRNLINVAHLDPAWPGVKAAMTAARGRQGSVVVTAVDRGGPGLAYTDGSS